MYTYRFTIAPEREEASYERLLAVCHQRLQEAEVSRLTTEGNAARFECRLLASRNEARCRLGVRANSGQIVVHPEAGQVSYSLSFANLVLLGSAFTGFVALMILLSGPPLAPLCCTPFLWLWVVGMEYLTSLARFDRFMKRCIRDAGFVVVKRRHAAAVGQHSSAHRWRIRLL